MVSLFAPLAAFALASAAAPAGAASTNGPSAKQLTLRLADVPGYAIERTGPDDTCSAPVFVSDVRRDVLRLLRRSWRDGCNLMLTRTWTVPGAQPGPSSLQSVAEILVDPDAASALLRRPRAFASSVVPIPHSAWRARKATAAIGDATRLLRAGGSTDSDERRGTAVLWRTGSVIAVVYAAGCDQVACEREAVRLATVQQSRIAAPTAVLPSAFDDSEVGLEDPRLDVPVWWTGRDFRAPGLRRVRLLSSTSAEPEARRYGERVTLTYGLNESWPAFQIELSHPSGLERRAVRRDLRALARDRCIRVERFAAPAGTATLYVRRRNCEADFAIGHAAAILRRPDVTITASCDCLAVLRRYRPLHRYGTAAAVRTIVRALRLREARTSVP